MPMELRAAESQTSKAVFLAKRGGLLTSLTLTPGGDPARAVELLYMPHTPATTETGWPGGGMPLMFPFAGRVFHDGHPFQYELGGQRLNMPLHGFAYALPWSVESRTLASATLHVEADAKTETLYPYDFALTMRYEVHTEHLRVRITVENRGLMPGAVADGLPQAMPVALGLHPYFRMPLAAASKSECRLVTTAQEKIAVTNAGGAGKATPFPDGAAQTLDQPLLANLILGRHGRPEASLVDPAAGIGVTVAWDEPEIVKYAVLWSREGEPFHCLEPWMGLPDAVSTGAGVRWLERGETLALGFSIRVTEL